MNDDDLFPPSFELDTVCPFCKGRHDRQVSTTGGEKPVDGNVCLCMRCGNISVFDSAGEKLIKPSREQLKAFLLDDELRHALAAWMETVGIRDGDDPKRN